MFMLGIVEIVQSCKCTPSPMDTLKSVNENRNKRNILMWNGFKKKDIWSLQLHV